MKLSIKGKNLGVRVMEFKDKETKNPYTVCYVSIYQEGEKPIELKCLPSLAGSLEPFKEYDFTLVTSEYNGKTYYKIVGLN